MSNLISCEQPSAVIFEVQDEEQLLKLFQQVDFRTKAILKFNCKSCGEPFQRKGISQVKFEYKTRKDKIMLCRSCSKKAYQEKLSEEEKLKRKEKRSKASKTFWEKIDSEKRELLSEKRRNNFKNWFENLSDDEKQKLSAKRSESQRKRYSKPEEREKVKERSKKAWEKTSTEEKQARINLLKEASKNRWKSLSKEEKSEIARQKTANLTDEKKKERSRKISEKRKAYFQRASKEELEIVSSKRKQSLLNRSPEEKAQALKKSKETFSRKSKEELEAINRKRSQTFLNKTEEEKKSKREKYLNWWNSLSEEDKKARSQKIGEKVKRAKANMTVEQKLETRRKASSHLGKYKATDGECFDSSWELKFYEFHKNKGNNIIREPRILQFEFQGKLHSFVPDFEVNNQLIELKGEQFFNKDGEMINPFDQSQNELYEAKHQCGLKNNVIFLREKDLKSLGIL